jgi:hypothetical protein
LENFFTLFLGTSLSVKRVRVFQGEESGWLIQKINDHREKVSQQMWVRCPYGTVSEALAKWLSVPTEKQSVELTVLGMVRKSRLFDEIKFLSLAQALEGFGRIRFVFGERGKTPFGDLVERTYDLISPEFAERLLGERSAFRRKVVQTRNFYTLLGRPRGTEATKDNMELLLLNNTIQALLRCVILIDLGVPEDCLRDPILYQATRWQVW